MKVDYKRCNIRRCFFFSGATSLLLVSVFFLDRAHGTHSLVSCGSGYRCRPSELAKPALDLVFGVFSAEQNQVHGRLAQYAASGVAPTMVFLG